MPTVVTLRQALRAWQHDPRRQVGQFYSDESVTRWVTFKPTLTTMELVVNRNTAQLLGLAIPSQSLISAELID